MKKLSPAVAKMKDKQVLGLKSDYRGRFAPSPTGKLHFGSLVAAMASYADAKSHGGHWSLRIDDIDTPRIVANSELHILSKLEHLGFQWDSEIVRQSNHLNDYQEAINYLEKYQLIYDCGCSRKEIKQISPNGIYPGTCRNGLKDGKIARLKRFNTIGHEISFFDQIQGQQHFSLEENSGDFIIHRADGIFAYQLAVVVDDCLANITHVVRGIDLLDSTPKQILLQQMLGYSSPIYAHIPLIVDPKNNKLGKKTNALEVHDDVSTLYNAALCLGQSLERDIIDANKEEFWQALINNWQLKSIPKAPSIVKLS